MESKYMTLEKYAATLKVGDEVTIEYHSMAGDRQTIEKILKITKSGTIYLRSTNCKDAIRFRKNGQWLDNFGYQGGLISGYSLKNPYKNPFDFTRVKIADLDHSDGCPLLGVIVVNEPDSEPIIYLR